MRGIVLNNLGVAHIYSFIALSSAVEDPLSIPKEKAQPIIDHAMDSVRCLKESVLALEQFPERLKYLEGEQGNPED